MVKGSDFAASSRDVKLANRKVLAKQRASLGLVSKGSSLGVRQVAKFAKKTECNEARLAAWFGVIGVRGCGVSLGLPRAPIEPVFCP